jgi:hypothetical protein
VRQAGAGVSRGQGDLRGESVGSAHLGDLRWGGCIGLVVTAGLPLPLRLPRCSGGMIFTFYKAQGLSVGASLVEEDKLELAKELMSKAKVGRVGPGGSSCLMMGACIWQSASWFSCQGCALAAVPMPPSCGPSQPNTMPPPPSSQAKGVEFVLPTDVVVADKFAADAASKVVPVDAIPDGWMVRGGWDAASSACAAQRCWHGPAGTPRLPATLPPHPGAGCGP